MLAELREKVHDIVLVQILIFLKKFSLSLVGMFLAWRYLKQIFIITASRQYVLVLYVLSQKSICL